MRKPIAISEVYSDERNQGNITVICDDGSIWTKVYGDPWKRVDDIPQEGASQ